jgi:histidinol-phosphate aminotransferase
MHDTTLTRRQLARLLGTATAAAAIPRLAVAAPAKEVRLSANENPYGPSPAAMRALREALPDVFMYPFEAEERLAESIARLHGVSTGEVLLGDGSSDILRLAAAAFPRKVVTADPTFESIARHVAAEGGEVVKVALTGTHAHDLERMLDAARTASLVYVCNPNNPTGTITPRAAVRAFLDAVPPSVAVLVDEAYHHYTASADYESVLPLVASKPNLVVARTFSKIYGMAGLRCGYAIAQPKTIAQLARHQAYDVMNSLALTAAQASLADVEYVSIAKKRNADTRAWLSAELAKMSLTHLPSETNFVMIDMRRDVRPLLAGLRERNVRVGRLFPAMPQHMRVTIGTPEQMRMFVDALRTIA